MCIDRDIIRIIVREEYAEELEKIERETKELERESKELERETKELERETEKIKSTLKLVRKQHNLPPDAKKIIDSLLAD